MPLAVRLAFSVAAQGIQDGLESKKDLNMLYMKLLRAGWSSVWDSIGVYSQGNNKGY
jgi:hypothetical protein